MVRSSVVFAGIAPHPPIMVPEVGGGAAEEVRASINAMRDFTERIIASGAETVVLISPHAPLEARSFVAYGEETLYGSFANFRAPGTEIEVGMDEELLTAISQTARERGYVVSGIKGYELDHGTAVPLYFLLRNGWRGRVVALGYTFLSNEDHLSFGSCIRDAAARSGKPVAFVASGDLSHRLKPGAPAGYNETAHLFDEEVIAAIGAGTPERIINIDPELRRTAGECGYRSMLVALGVAESLAQSYEVLSYEAPFGVGYLVAQLSCERAAESEHVSDASLAESLPALARLATETFIREGRQIKPPAISTGTRAACFVSIKTMSGDLRGCIGTIEPVKDSLEEELIANAINAATRDPRFPPVSTAELTDLRYSVDVLSEPEPTRFEELDPKVYGVIVEDEHGLRRGLLLPDIEGVETAAQQVSIAARKAGIDPNAPLKLFRFCVERFREPARHHSLIKE
ncbi:MAG: AmmeMemoRadiSam system protein A [Acidobacteria bacterium]|nr:AmmeMemoRadiSam system protein A [Acidobacteriota bacterium]